MFCSAIYTLFKNGRNLEKNWHELHENKVIRASLGGIRIRKLTSRPYDIIAIFLRFQTGFLRLRICKTVRKRHLALMTSFSFNSCQFFFKWQPFLNKVYSYTTIFHILHELILIIYYKLCAHLFSNIVYQLGYTVKDIHVHACIVKYPIIGIICPHVKYSYSSADLTEQWSCFLWTGRGRKLQFAVCRQFATSSWGCSSCSDP